MKKLKMPLKKKKKTRQKKEVSGIAKIVSSAYSNYRKNKEQNKI